MKNKFPALKTTVHECVDGYEQKRIIKKAREHTVLGSSMRHVMFSDQFDLFHGFTSANPYKQLSF